PTAEHRGGAVAVDVDAGGLVRQRHDLDLPVSAVQAGCRAVACRTPGDAGVLDQGDGVHGLGRVDDDRPAAPAAPPADLQGDPRPRPRGPWGVPSPVARWASLGGGWPLRRGVLVPGPGGRPEPPPAAAPPVVLPAPPSASTRPSTVIWAASRMITPPPLPPLF